MLSDHNIEENDADYHLCCSNSVNTQDQMKCYVCFRTFCDFTIKLDSGAEIKTHKMVLSSVSTYFSALFQSQMIETQQGFVELKGMKDVAMLVRDHC